jgi:site-specific DNA-methyltransferase (adenine-specific)
MAQKSKAFDHSKYANWINPALVKPYERNVKEHNERQVKNIANSIQRYSWQQDTVLTTDNVLVIGHGRWMAAKKLGCEMPYHLIDKTADEVTDEDIRELRIVDNQTNAETGFDWEVFSVEAEDLDFEGFEFDFGLDDQEDEPPEAEDDDFDEEPPENPKSQRGDIYKLGRHRLMCGDSTSIDDVQALVNGRDIDLLITDPPYNVDYEGGTGMTIMNDNMEDETFRQFLRDAYTAADAVMKSGAAFYIWHADSEGYNFRGACHDIGWKVRQCLIWVKDALVLGRQDYQWRHEPCLYGWKEGTHNWFSDRKQTTVLEFDRPKKSELHPTMKPVPLFDYQIRNSTRNGDAVLDLFGGSGTTLICCEQNGRDAFVMELDPKYVDVIVKRWETLTGQKAVLLNRSTEEDS